MGILLQPGPQRVAATLKLRDAYGGIMRLWLTGGTSEVRLVHPDTAKILLQNSTNLTKPFGYRFLEPWLGRGLLTETNGKWKHRRKMLTPAFHFGIVKATAPVVGRQAAVLVKKWEKVVSVAGGSADVDIDSDIKMCALDIVCEASMGTELGAQAQPDHPYVSAVATLGEEVTNRFNMPWLWPDFAFALSDVGRRHGAALKIAHDFTSKIISERRAELQNGAQTQTGGGEVSAPRSFLDLVLALEEPEEAGGGPLSDAAVRQEVDTFMFAGHDTISTALTWLLLEVGQQPELQRRLREELTSVMGATEVAPTYEQLSQLPLLEATVKEGLRLHPPAPFVARMITSELEFRIPRSSTAFVGSDPSVARCADAAVARSGVEGEALFRVPEGAICTVDIIGIHTNPQVWDEPLKFKPERFLDSSMSHRPFAFIPFSAGARNCIGQKFALIEAKVLLGTIVRKFKVTTLNAADVEGHPNIVMCAIPSPVIRFEMA